MAFIVRVNSMKCIGCGRCERSCPEKVYEINGKKAYPANARKCVGCQKCARTCPVSAITVA